MLESLFADRSVLPNAVNGAAVHDVIKLLRTVSNREYRNLLGVFNYIRQSDTSVSLEQALLRILRSDVTSSDLKVICGLLKSIRDEGYQHHARHNPLVNSNSGIALVNAGAQWDKEFSDRTLRLIRALYPLGINMQNPELAPDLEQRISARHVVTILIPGHRDRGRIQILPDGDCSCVMHDVRGKFKPEFAPIALKDGRAIRVGRPLSFEHDIFGRPVPRGGITFPVSAVIDDERTSRGGVLIVRHQGFLYLFDCGSRHEVTFSYERGQWTRYEPRARLSEDGYENGQSGVYRRRAE